MNLANRVLKALGIAKEPECKHEHLDGEIVILARDFCTDCLKTVRKKRLTAKEFITNFVEVEPMTQSQGGKEE